MSTEADALWLQYWKLAESLPGVPPAGDEPSPNDVSVPPGSAGFVAFCRAADEWKKLGPGHVKRPVLKSEADTLLADPDCQAFIRSAYEIFDQELSGNPHIRLHEVGTTSYILRLNTGDLALKLLKPSYVGNRQIESIMSSYEATYGGLADELNHFPVVRSSGPRYLLMSFVHAQPLQSLLDVDTNDASRIFMLRSIVVELCGILQTLHRLTPPVHHGDISPSNLLVATQVNEHGQPEYRLTLIDFGLNYLLTESLGSGTFRDQWSRTAPELQWGAEPTALGDAYALGVLTAQGVLARDYDSADVVTTIDRVYKRYSELGDVLEDMLDPMPGRRLEGVPRDQDLFQTVADRISVALEAAESTARDEAHPFLRLMIPILELPFPGSGPILTALRRRRYVELMKQYGNRALLFPVMATYLLNVAVLFAIYHRVQRGGLASWVAVVPGLLVAASFSILASKYYMDIFSRVSVGRLAPATEVCFRMNAFVFAVPILLTVVLNDNLWSLAAAVGVYWVACNNVLSYKFCANGITSMKESNQRISHDMEAGTERFFGWSWIAIAYMLGLALVALGLGAGWLHDIWAYAIFVALVANFKMYFFNCSRDAPLMRTALVRVRRGRLRSQRETGSPSQ